MLRVAGRRLGTQTYNLLRTLTEAGLDPDAAAPSGSLDEPRGPHDDDGFNVHGDPPMAVAGDAPSLMDGYYSKEPLHTPPGGEWDSVNVEDRFQSQDPFADPLRMEQPNEHFEQNMGYSRPSDTDGAVGPAVRMGSMCQVRGQLEDPTAFIVGLVEAAARAGLPYEDLPLNEHRERAVVTGAVIGRWLHTLGLDEHSRNHVFDAANTDEGLDAIGTGLIAAGLAETANIAHYGEAPILVLTRNKESTSWT